MSGMSSIEGMGIDGRMGPLLNRQWLKERFQAVLDSKVRVWVLAAEPGMGKSLFLKELAKDREGSIFIDLRPPLETTKSSGFWSALLSQLNIPGTQIPNSPFAAALLAKERLASLGQPPRLIILDALERAPELFDSSGLAGLDNLGENSLVVVGARPGKHVDILQAAGARVDWIEPQAAENLAELTLWAQCQFPEAPTEFVAHLVKSSGGNFLVARHLFQAVQSGLLEIHEAEQTPPALEAALSVLWDDHYAQAPLEVQDDLIFVACLIAEAGEPLPAMSIADFLGFSASRVERALNYLRPLLRPCEADQGLTFFSPRLGKFIAQRYRRDLVQVHEQVISFFRDSYPSWEEMDDRYGWFYLGYHCDRFARTSRRRDFSLLHWLGEGPYIKIKLTKTHSLNAVLEDLSRCLRASLEDRDLPRIVSYGLRIPRLRAREVMNGLHDLADAGMFDLAADRALLLRRESSRLKALLLLAWQALDEGHVDVCKRMVTLAKQVVDADIVSEDRLLFAFLMADLLKVVSLKELEPIFLGCSHMRHSVSVLWRLSIMKGLAKGERLAILKLALRCARQLTDKEEMEHYVKKIGSDIVDLRKSKGPDSDLNRPLIEEVNSVKLGGTPDAELAKMIEAVGQADPQERAQAFRNALEYTGTYKDEAQRVEAIASLVLEIVKYSNESWILASFEDLITTIVALHSPVYRQQAIIATARLITGVPRLKGWRDVFVRLGAVIETIEDPSLRVGAWIWLALARYEARDYKGAQDVLNLSASLAFHITDLEEQAKALSLLSSCAAAIDNPARARNLAFHALQAWEAPAPKRIDTETKAAMVMGVSANVNEERSLEYYDSSIKIALEIPDMRVRANLLAALAGNLYKMGEDDWARRTQDQALDVAKSMQAGASQAVTLAQLAVQESQCGNVSSFDQVLNDAELSARAEVAPEKRREALLTIASAKRSGGDEAGARKLILEIVAELEKLNYRELSKASDLWALAKLIREPKSKEILVRLLRRVSKNLRVLHGVESQETLLLLVRCWLALGEMEQAGTEFLQISDVKVKSQAKISLAVSTIKSNPEAAVKLLGTIPIFSERMRGIEECGQELMRSNPASKRSSLLETLTELTLMAVEDERCADVLIAKWVELSSDRKAIVESLAKIGYPLKDVLTGQLNEPPLVVD